MKMFLVLLISTIFVASCGSKKKSSDTAKAEDAKKVEAGENKTSEGSQSNVAGDKVNCMMKSDKRTIQVRKSGGGCELAYSKFGNDEVVASSLNGTEHCQKIADRIQGNLENAGFKCE